MFARLLPDRHKRALTLTFFGIILLLGLALVRDYGISFDEGVQRVSGQISLFYIFQKLPAPLQHRLLSPQAVALIASKGKARQLKDYTDRDYGVVFELPASAAEQVLRLHDERQIYLLRHGLTFLVCFAGLVAFYVLAAWRFASWRVGLLGALLLVVSPRLFADYFYNDKDAVFMALFTVAAATGVAFIRRPTWKTAAWHALGCALAIDVRIMGVLMPAATLAFVALRALKGDYRRQTAWTPIGLYVGLLAVLIVALWPYLWEAPVANFTAAFRNMSHFRWPGSVLYQGHMVLATHLPWHYPLVWIGLTTPLLYLTFFGIGIAVIISKLVARRWQLYTTDCEWQDLFFLGLAIAPVAAVIGLHSVLYNGWRQLYFVYPLLLLVALRGMLAVWQWCPTSASLKHYWQPLVSTVVASSLAVIAGHMMQLHPFEHLYFNALAPTPTEQHYDADYWGLSFRQGLEWLVDHDSRPHIQVYSPTYQPLALNRLILPAADRNRLEIVKSAAQADYVISSYDYPTSLPYHNPIFTMQIANMRLLDIFRLK